MRHVVRRGVTFADPDFAHSVHVDVDRLSPGRPVPGISSTPEANGARSAARGRGNSSWESPRRLRFAFASCQHFEHGLYTAYQHMAGEDLDLVLFLGDYIYEDGVSPTLPRQHDGAEPMTLGGLSQSPRSLQERRAFLQATHAAFPWLVVFDDHEVENNWAGPFDQNGSAPELFLPRRAQAFRRTTSTCRSARRSIPRGPDIQLYRRMPFGDLAEFNMLDTRQFRDDQACGDGTDIGCAEALDPNRTITGREQERWLLRGLNQSRARWNVIGQQVFMAQRDFEAGAQKRLSMDGWDGYAASRDRVLGYVKQRRIANVVVLTGDVHANYAAELKADFDDPTSDTIGTELVGTSITSGGDGFDVPASAGCC